MQKSRVLLARVPGSPREGEASLLGRQACWSCQHIRVWLSSLCRGLSYGGGTIPAMAVQWEWWLLTNSPAPCGSLAVIMASVLAFVSSGRSHDVIVRGEWLSIVGCLLPRSRSCCPNLARSGRGHRIRSEWESWLLVVIPIP